MQCVTQAKMLDKYRFPRRLHASGPNKLIYRSLDGDRILKSYKTQEAFLSELRYFHVLNHPNLEKCELFTAQKNCVTPFYSSVIEAYQTGKISLNKIITDLMSGMKYFHSCGLCYLNYSLDNIRYDEASQNVVFCNFSQIRECVKDTDDKLFIPASVSSPIVYHSSYSDPELNEQEYTPWEVELYALGMFLYFLVRGTEYTESEYTSFKRSKNRDFYLDQISFNPALESYQEFIRSCLQPLKFRKGLDYLTSLSICGELTLGTSMVYHSSKINSNEYGLALSLMRNFIMEAIELKWSLVFIMKTLHLFRNRLLNIDLTEYLSVCKYLSRDVTIGTFEVPDFEILNSLFEQGFSDYSYYEMCVSDVEILSMLALYLHKSYEDGWCVVNHKDISFTPIIRTRENLSHNSFIKQLCTEVPDLNLIYSCPHGLSRLARNVPHSCLYEILSSDMLYPELSQELKIHRCGGLSKYFT